jgi:hypothetical protein
MKLKFRAEEDSKKYFKTVTNSFGKQLQQDISICPVIPQLHILQGYCKNT